LFVVILLLFQVEKMTEQHLTNVKKLLRSVLIPEKDGIPLNRISREKIFKVEFFLYMEVLRNKTKLT